MRETSSASTGATERRYARRLIAVAVCLGFLAAGADAVRDRLALWVATTNLPPLTISTGTEVLARDGSLLRAFQVADGRWRLAPATVDPLFTKMLIAWEDRRFYDHHGVDGRAMLRAASQAARHGRIVSGGSTLSMQVARLLEEGPTGQWSGKLRQMRVAMALEHQLSKAQIIDLYERLAPYGANVEGVRAASLLWFGREPARLTPAQAALLVALPQAPEGRRPDRFPDAAKAARDRVLKRAADMAIIPMAEAQAAMTEPLPSLRRAFPARAPLLAARLARSHAPGARIETTLSPPLQLRAEAVARRAIQNQPRGVSAAVIIADHRTGEILAEVGAADWSDTASAGFVDMTQAVRSPGSTLKPFVYGLAFDQGLAHPETLIEDRPTAFGRWMPQNFDNQFRGTVSIRQALVWSLNIPVVKLAEALGPARIVQVLSQGGIRLRGADMPGLAIVLGGAGVTLEDLANGYAALARGGRGIVLSAQPGAASERPARLFGAAAAWQVGHILSQVTPPNGGQPGRIAFKTGTSYGHRDALAVGFDGRHVVAVWMGRPDGTPVPGAFGGELAAPLVFDLFDALPASPLPPPPADTLTVTNSALPLPLRRFAQPGEVSVSRDAPREMLRVTFPPDGADIATTERLLIKARGGTGPWTFLLNGIPVAVAQDQPQASISAEPGFSRLTVIDGQGASASATIRLR